MLIDDGKIEEIKRSSDIVEIISEYVSLSKTGNNFKGLCPFHNEKTPSFVVSPEKQIFHCFGCGAGGNVFTFLMKHENTSFPDTLHLLAKKYGIVLKFSSDRKDSESLEWLFRINDEAKKLFISNLNGKEGKDAFAYLRARGFDDEILKEYEIGYAPAKWEYLSTLLAKDYSAKQIIKSGLVVKRNDGNGFYDRFRNRIIFPIFDRDGRTRGFGARALDKEEGAKYINSPETPLFKKSKILYGFSKAKKEISAKKRVFITEGYIDVIMGHKYGFPEVVAPLGTSLTDEQIKTVKIYADNLFFVFDADKAGVSAVVRSWEKISGTKLSSRVLLLPSGEDLDSTLRKKGRGFLEKLTDESVDTGEFVISNIISGFDIGDSGGKKKALNKVFEMLSSILDNFNFAVYSSFLSESLKVDENLIIDAYKKIKKPFNYEKKKTNHNYSRTKEINSGFVLESYILTIAMTSGEMGERIFEKINPETIENKVLRRIAFKIKESLEKGNFESLGTLLLQESDDELLGLFSELSLKSEEIIDIEKSFDDCLKKYLQREIKRNLKTNKIQIEKALMKGDKAEIDSLLRENQKLQASVKNSFVTTT